MDAVANQQPDTQSDAWTTRRRWRNCLILLASLLLLGIVIYPFDMDLAPWLQKTGELPGDFRRILALSELMAHGTGVAIVLAIIWCVVPHQRLHLPRIAACAYSAGLAASGLKLMHARIRPLACPPNIQEAWQTWRGWLPTHNDNLGQTYDYALQSFPSAHTATAVGFAIGMMWLYPRGRYIFVGLAILAGFQRIVFHAHWPSDVAFGAAIGLFFGACFVLPGTVGNWIFDRLEWRFGMGRDLHPLKPEFVVQAPEDKPQRKAA